jgi:hypothetical protein
VLFGVWDVRVQDYASYAKAQESAGKKVDGSWKTQNRDGVPVGRELDHPVVGVNWDDAQAFCQWLTEKESAEGKLPKGLKYRLPSDEEWSWAVGLPPELAGAPAEKSGKDSVDFPWGKDWPPTKKVGNYGDETFHAKFPKDGSDKTKDQPWIKDYTDGYATTSPVGSFPANAYGLFDMGGNVWQWCEDWFDKDQKDRALRGAGWGVNGPVRLLSSNRNRYAPGSRNHGNGFRCVLAGDGAGNGTASAATSGGWISLMDKIDPAADGVKGTWKRNGSDLQGQNKQDGVLQLPYEAPAEYDFRIAYTPQAGACEAIQILAAGGHQFAWTTAAAALGNTYRRACFERLKGFLVENSPAAVTLDAPLQLGHRYESLVEVRRDRVTGYIDGRKIVEWKTDYSDLSLDKGLAPPNQRALGVAVWGNTVTFHDISVREVTGKGSCLR